MNGKKSGLVLALSMVMGSAFVVGCNQATVDSIESSVVAATDSDLGSTADAERVWGRGWVGQQRWAWARHAPPVAVYERPGNPPSARHFWVNGYHRWTGDRYVWVGGHWDLRRDGATYVQPHYDVVDGEYRFVPGHWA